MENVNRTDPELAGLTDATTAVIHGPGHTMDLMPEATNRPDLVEEYGQRTGTIPGVRDGWDAFPDPHAGYGRAWRGPGFVLTHRPEDHQAADGVTFFSGEIAEAVQIASAEARGKSVEVLSTTIGRQMLEHGVLDEIALHVLPVLHGGPAAEINLRYRRVGGGARNPVQDNRP